MVNDTILILADRLTYLSRLNTFCKRGDESVPRSRVFQRYATKCGNERVPTLNPASFGKLVRIIFPGIQTRRLGMRGESKYNYVDLVMREDFPEEEPVDATFFNIAHAAENQPVSQR